MKNTIKILSLISFCMIICSCGTVPSVTSGIALDKGTVYIENKTFFKYVELIEEPTTVLDGDFLKAQITIKNKYDKDINFQYQFSWYDKNGMVIKSATKGWKIFNITGKDEAVIQGICPLPDAKKFKLVVRPL